MSMASCASWNSGNPSTTTSSHLWSTATFSETRPLASLHTRAAALSNAKPRLPNTPETAHADRWWTATPANGRGQKERAPKAAEEQHPEDVGVETGQRGSRATSEGDGCKRATSLPPAEWRHTMNEEALFRHPWRGTPVSAPSRTKSISNLNPGTAKLTSNRRSWLMLAPLKWKPSDLLVNDQPGYSIMGNLSAQLQ